MQLAYSALKKALHYDQLCTAVFRLAHRHPHRSYEAFMTPARLLSYDIPLFDGVAAADLASVPLQVTEQRMTAWQTVFHQHDVSHDLYFLLDGQLIAIMLTSDGREIVFSQFTAGSYFGELAALDGTPRSLAVVTKTDANVLVMSRATFLALFDQVPPIRCKITQGLVTRIRQLTRRNFEMAALSVEQRVAAFILRLASRHGTSLAGLVIDPAPTHADIAATIGANREMVSRSLSRLAQQDIISTARRRITVINPAALADLLT